MKVNLKIFTLFIVFWFTNFYGIIRHDVAIQKHTDLANESRFDCVGQLMVNNEPKSTCFAISDLYIITAAHNLYDVKLKEDSIIQNGMKMIVYNETDTRELNPKEIKIQFHKNTFEVDSILIHPSYNGLEEKTIGIDIAIIKLKNPIKIAIEYPKINALNNELNSTVIGVGYGVFGVGNSPKTEIKNIKIAGFNVIDKIKNEGDCKMLLADFDSPLKGRKFNKMGSSTPHKLEYIPSAGDSGSPLFREIDDKLEAIGVLVESNSPKLKSFLKFGHYGTVAKWQSLAQIYDWITTNTINT